jgi:hypothetical protein
LHLITLSDSHTHSVPLLWRNDRPVAETDTGRMHINIFFVIHEISQRQIRCILFMQVCLF